MYLMREKSEASKFLMSFYQLVKTQLGKLVKRIWSEMVSSLMGQCELFMKNMELHMKLVVLTHLNKTDVSRLNIGTSLK